MSLIDSLKERIRGRRKEKEDDFKKLAFYIHNDKRLDQRIEDYMLFYQYIKECTFQKEEIDHKTGQFIKKPTDKINNLTSTINDLNQLLGSLAKPYGRAGSKERENLAYGTMVSAWDRIYSLTVVFANSVRNQILYLDRSAEDKFELYDKLMFFFNICYLYYSVALADLSWYDKDVSPSFLVAMQQQQNVMGGGGFGAPVDLAGGRTSGEGMMAPPPRRKYPEEMSSEVDKE